MKKILALGLGIILIAAACNKTPVVTENPTPTPTPAPAPTPNPSSDVLSGEVTINITSSGFTPSTITVKKGTKVTFKNTDSVIHAPASNPHPTHTDLPGFDSGQGVAPGSSYSYTFDQVGKWKFHDHLFSTRGGTVTVVE